MNPTIMQLTARALLGRRRVLLLLPMPVVLIGLTLLGRAAPVPASDWGPTVFGDLGLGVILPLTALIIGSSVLGLEIEDGTITHLLTKPLPRSEIILSKLTVAWAVTTVATAVPLAAAGLIAGSPGLALGLVVGDTIGALAYSASFLALSLVTRRPVAAGLVYIVLWENLLGGFVSGTRIFSIHHQTASLTGAIADSELITATLAAPLALVLAGVFTVAGTVLATTRLRSFALTGDTG
ncbi:MAG TPA: ABC transporter permease subunit [Actinophytocola sp.]|uniref:ABC transporter permease n=1 Tax=Actinophytocola sp. TaxID=1872138 RepID=UPI002DDCB0AD|nr:ABC transporter permease subunit [Actinophytocola sp.]HEV2784311.1 ABC transporter permease subunit [Actinophytocola sp.]